MRVSALMHAPFETLGAIQTWLGKKGYKIVETHTYRGDRTPALESFDWLIVMGGPQNLKQLEQYSYLQEEIRLIKQALQNGKPVLGICLGAQLIAESLGAKTEASPEKEIGVFGLQLTGAGYADPIMQHFPDQFPATHWHSDMPGIPAGAAILATSQGCPRQIIRFKTNVYGLQCHFELTSNDIYEMVKHDQNDLIPNLYVQTKEELLNYNYANINQQMFLFLDHFSKIIVDSGIMC